MSFDLLIATSNEHKFEEMADELHRIGVHPVSIRDRGVELRRPEAGEDYRENATIKAQEGYDRSGIPSLADDSGLEVDALDGRPGVYSDRWAGEDADADEQNRKLLEELEGVAPRQRTARYICEMVLVDDTGVRLTSRGVCEGRIARSPRGEGGFGYDPLFEVTEADGKTFAELPPESKLRLSHRARALKLMLQRIRASFPDRTASATDCSPESP